MINDTMVTSTTQTPQYTGMAKHLICWKSTFAGLALALMTYLVALSLATAFGGIGLSDGATAQNAGIFAGVSVAVATLLATFVGGYFTVRLARTQLDMLGSAQGLLVGAIFLSFVVFQIFSVAGTLGSAAAHTLGATASAASSGASAMSQSPMVREIVEDNFGNMNLRSEPNVVIQGVASRLLSGNTESAKNYLAGQAGITREEADQKIAAIQTQVNEMATQARVATANALKATGWSLFVVLCLGLITSILGGLTAAIFNVRSPLDVATKLTRSIPSKTTRVHA